METKPAEEAVTGIVQVSDILWKDIVAHYSSPTRYYHTLDHLDQIITDLLPLRHLIRDWTAVVLATAYHDLVYDPTRKDNEERSAAYAVEKLSGLLKPQTLERCRLMILATKQHLPSPDADTNYFLDADLAILAADRERYFQYTRQIRREYEVFPDAIYVPGRKQVLKHFLERDRIYTSGYFYDRHESAARQNLKEELVRLTEEADY